MMLVHLLIFFYVIVFCHGKSLNRGKRSYYYQGAEPQYQGYYDQQNANTKYLPQSDYYIPQVDGQPIYVPSIGHSAKEMHELLQDYYGRNPVLAQAWAHPTPVPYDYNNGNNYYENPVTSNSIVKDIFSSTDVDGHRGDYHILSSKSQSEYVPYPHEYEREEYKDKLEAVKDKTEKHYMNYGDMVPDENLAPEVVKKVNKKKNGDENSDLQKTKPVDDYDEPIVRNKVNVKNSYLPKTESDLGHVNEYEPPIIRDRINMKKQSSIDKKENELEYKDYEQPAVRDRVNIKSSKGKRRKQFPKKYETGNKHSLPIKGNLENSDKNEKIDTPLDVEYPEMKKTEIKNKDVMKYEPEETSVKPKDKVVIKSKPKETPDKTKDKVVIKKKGTQDKSKDKVVIKKGTPDKSKEKVVIKTKETPDKDKVVIKTKETPDKVVTKTKETSDNYKQKDVDKTKNEETADKTMDKVVVKRKSPDKSKDKDGINYESEYGSENLDYNKGVAVGNKTPIEKLNAEDIESNEDESENEELEKLSNSEDQTNNPNEPFNTEDGNESEFENASGKPVISKGSANVPNDALRSLSNDALRSLSALNANIWSLIFNPNAERHKLKKCLTRTNETGFCTYVQHCEVPDIAASLEQLLNNACVIDDIFIGVCCPEFPVETVQVHWEHDTALNSGKQTEAEFDDDADDCGIRSNEATKEQSWPWKAPLVSMSNGKIFCGGVIISENYVLTAAHCTTKIPKNQILVRLGQFNDSTGDDFAVVEIKRHAQYNPRTMHNDIALLKLGRRIMQDEYTGVICLPDGDDEDDEHDGEKAILLGWKGMFGKNSKKTEFLEIMEKEECRNKLGTNVPKTMLCTEARNEDERTCNADSGAPLVIEDDDKYEVIGILSWNRNDCDQRFPSTFSRVSRYVGWIRKHAV